jgi:hypothetical protein
MTKKKKGGVNNEDIITYNSTPYKTFAPNIEKVNDSTLTYYPSAFALTLGGNNVDGAKYNVNDLNLSYFNQRTPVFNDKFVNNLPDTSYYTLGGCGGQILANKIIKEKWNTFKNT